MNADKIADALRRVLKWDAGPQALEDDGLREYRADMAFARKTLAEYDAQPAQAAQTDIFEAYKTWPADIREKLSLRDLRRMSGWVPSGETGGWSIDTSTPSPILTYQKCSVIQDEQAYYVLDLIRMAAQSVSVPDGWVMVPREPDEAMLAAIDELRPPSGSPEQITSTDFRSRWRDRHRRAAKETYVAMHAAAPQPPASADAEELIGAASAYFNGYCVDEADDWFDDGERVGENTGVTREQCAAANRLRDAINRMRPKAARAAQGDA